VATQMHGALVEILDVGILITGPSGVGKSECVLELVQRGHRMVADDVVRLEREDDERLGAQLLGRAPETIRHYLEIRGIGLLCVPDIYGADAVREEAVVSLVCHLETWREGADYERIGIERPIEEIEGVEVAALVLPVRPATSMASLIEVAGRDASRRRQGFNAARQLDERLRVEVESR
jgi:HPr kinase/phosphorylase